ncbi:MAG: FeoA family protein [Longicatena sp.]
MNGGKNDMCLTFGCIGQVNSIKKVTGKDEIRQHLTELGFVVGGEVVIVSKIGKNMILSVKDSRIAIDETMANRIMI